MGRTAWGALSWTCVYGMCVGSVGVCGKEQRSGPSDSLGLLVSEELLTIVGAEQENEVAHVCV
jgi:hypothetical protein